MLFKERKGNVERRDEMFKLRGVEYKTLHELQKNNAYVVEVYEPKKEGEKYTLLSDTMFKAMFQNEGRIKYSCKLLSYLFEVSYEELLKNIVLLKNEVDKEKKNDKGFDAIMLQK